jgi:hypothetical protein
MKHLQHMESNMLLSATAFAALQRGERVDPETMWTADPDRAAIMEEKEAPPLGDVFRLIDTFYELRALDQPINGKPPGDAPAKERAPRRGP